MLASSTSTLLSGASDTFSAPRKYLVVTIVEALRLQKSGNSTAFCSKIVSPDFQFV